MLLQHLFEALPEKCELFRTLFNYGVFARKVVWAMRKRGGALNEKEHLAK